MELNIMVHGQQKKMPLELEGKKRKVKKIQYFDRIKG